MRVDVLPDISISFYSGHIGVQTSAALLMSEYPAGQDYTLASGQVELDSMANTLPLDYGFTNAQTDARDNFYAQTGSSAAFMTGSNDLFIYNSLGASHYDWTGLDHTPLYHYNAVNGSSWLFDYAAPSDTLHTGTLFDHNPLEQIHTMGDTGYTSSGIDIQNLSDLDKIGW